MQNTLENLIQAAHALAASLGATLAQCDVSVTSDTLALACTLASGAVNAALLNLPTGLAVVASAWAI